MEENNQVLGERTEISYQDIVNLKYCSCIFKESLRIYPPVVIVERVIKDEMDIEGYKIPKNTQIAVNINCKGWAPNNCLLKWKPMVQIPQINK